MIRVRWLITISFSSSRIVIIDAMYSIIIYLVSINTYSCSHNTTQLTLYFLYKLLDVNLTLNVFNWIIFSRPPPVTIQIGNNKRPQMLTYHLNEVHLSPPPNRTRHNYPTWIYLSTSSSFSPRFSIICLFFCLQIFT